MTLPEIVPPVSACCGASIREDDDNGSEYIRCRNCGEMSLIADDEDDEHSHMASGHEVYEGRDEQDERPLTTEEAMAAAQDADEGTR